MYIVNNVLKIGAEYLYSVNICYQFCVCIYIAQILRIPFVSLIISNETMSAYAVLSVLESIFKLLITYLLFLNEEKLIHYCFYIFMVTLLCTIITVVYCIIRFPTCRVSLKFFDIEILKNIFVFSNWTTLSSFSNSVSQQGGNILMNIYSGVIANAAWGIAHQVNTAFAVLASSLQNAFNPQINKSYAENDVKGLLVLLNRSSSITYYLILLIGIPIICNMDFILDYWLLTPPNYASSFCICIILYQMVDTMQAPFNTLIFATGQVKFYNIWLSSILILNIIISGLALFNGYSPICVPLTMLVLNVITGLLRFLHIIYKLKISIKDYFCVHLSRMLLVTVICFVGSYFLVFICEYLGVNNFVKVFFSFLLTLFVAFIIGLTNEDKYKLYKVIKHALM